MELILQSVDLMFEVNSTSWVLFIFHVRFEGFNFLTKLWLGEFYLVTWLDIRTLVCCDFRPTRKILNKMKLRNKVCLEKFQNKIPDGNFQTNRRISRPEQVQI